MIKNIIGGMAVGVANIIPGVSGGTIMVILGIFDQTIASISGITKRVNPQRKKDVFFLLQILLGAAIGLITFAKIIDWLFSHYPTHTMFWFVGLIVFSIPGMLKKELKGNKISWVSMLVAILIVFSMIYFNPGEGAYKIEVFPPITLFHVIKLLLISIIAGGTMLLPGVSGSMFLLIVGEYYLIKSYVANALSFDWIILIPLLIIGIGVMLGILLSAKIAQYFLREHRGGTVSFILGLIIASAIVLVPYNTTYNTSLILTSALAFIFGAAVIVGVEKFS